MTFTFLFTFLWPIGFAAIQCNSNGSSNEFRRTVVKLIDAQAIPRIDASIRAGKTAETVKLRDQLRDLHSQLAPRGCF